MSVIGQEYGRYFDDRDPSSHLILKRLDENTLLIKVKCRNEEFQAQITNDQISKTTQFFNIITNLQELTNALKQQKLILDGRTLKFQIKILSKIEDKEIKLEKVTELDILKKKVKKHDEFFQIWKKQKQILYNKLQTLVNVLSTHGSLEIKACLQRYAQQDTSIAQIQMRMAQIESAKQLVNYHSRTDSQYQSHYSITPKRGNNGQFYSIECKDTSTFVNNMKIDQYSSFKYTFRDINPKSRILVGFCTEEGVNTEAYFRDRQSKSIYFDCKDGRLYFMGKMLDQSHFGSEIQSISCEINLDENEFRFYPNCKQPMIKRKMESLQGQLLYFSLRMVQSAKVELSLSTL